MELTRTDAVFSRIAMVLFMCRSKRSRNDLKLHGATSQKIRKIPAKDEGQGAHYYLLSTVLDFPEEERMMQQSSVSISLSF